MTKDLHEIVEAANRERAKDFHLLITQPKAWLKKLSHSNDNAPGNGQNHQPTNYRTHIL